MQRDRQDEYRRVHQALGKTRESHPKARSCIQRTLLIMSFSRLGHGTRDPYLKGKCSHPIERGDEHANGIGGCGADLLCYLEESLLLGGQNLCYNWRHLVGHGDRFYVYGMTSCVFVIPRRT